MIARNKRIMIKQRPIDQESFDSPISEWPDLIPVWASIEPLSGREFFAAQQSNSEVTHKVNVAYNSTIKDNMGIVYGTRSLEILYKIDPEERHIELNLMCKELG